MMHRGTIGAAFALLALATLIGCSTTTGGGPTATVVGFAEDAVAFPGTSSATIDVLADGSWNLTSSASWLVPGRSSGTGSRTVTLTVDRDGLAPGSHIATVRVRGDGVSATLPVSMRFPHIRGAVEYDDGGAVIPLSLAELQAGQDYVEGEILIRLDAALVAASNRPSGLLNLNVAPLQRAETARVAATLARRHGLSQLRTLGGGDPVVVASTTMPMEHALAELHADPRVIAAHPNYRLQLLYTPNDAFYPDQWHYPMIGMEQAWDTTLGSSDIIVGVVDGGYHIAHEDLSAKWVVQYDFAEDDGNADATGTACAAHGTHVAGTVAAETNNGIGVAGVAPEARMIPLKIGAETLDGDGNPTCGLNSAALVAALKYLAGHEDVMNAGTLAPSQRPQVINLSIGGRSPLTSIEGVLEELANDDVTVVAAAGNDAASPVMYPARYATVIGVGAVDHEGNLASYSAFGEGLDVLAPGGSASGGLAQNVVSTLPPTDDRPNGGYGSMAGTSMASPHVAGVVALMLALDPNLNVEGVRSLLHRGADGFEGGWTEERGYGLIHVPTIFEHLSDDRYDRTFVGLWQGGSQLRETGVDAAGAFVFEHVAAGEYLVDGYTEDADGNFEYYGMVDISVAYDGDHFVTLTLE